jgi:hypothetical protein
MCYNCSFLYSVSPITDKQVAAAEDSVDRQVRDFDWEVDDAMKEHLESLGLWNEVPTDGSQYISENFKRNEKED